MHSRCAKHMQCQCLWCHAQVLVVVTSGVLHHWIINPQKDRMLISKAWDESKTMLTSKALVEDKNDFWKDLRWRPSSRLFSVIHSKLGGYTHWVHLGAPNEVQGPAIRNADLQGTSVRQSTSFRVIKAEGDSKKSFLPNCPESISCHKRRPQAGPMIFGLITFKLTQRSGACGG